MRKTLLFAVLVIVSWGCSSDEKLPQKTTGPAETISPPIRAVGPDVVGPGQTHTFTSGGASSSLGDPVEYRFDFDAGGAHDYTTWTRSSLAQKSWASGGIKTILVQARCEIHTDKVSEWSISKLVEIGGGPNTEITGAINTYFIGGNKFTEVLNLSDAVPDTVPYGSWIKVLYDGIPSAQGDSLCADDINECLQYQMNYTWTSERRPGQENTIAWRPFDPEDTNPDGVSDSTTMNVGSVSYTVRARSTDQFSRSDTSAAEIHVVGNFPPTLDSQSVTDHGGSPIADGDTIVWDWWDPANAPDTVDVITNPNDPQVVKTFYFVVHATGHDHPKEMSGSGVKGWKYSFKEVGSNPPVFEDFSSRAGDFVDGSTVNVLSDTVSVTFRHSLVGDPGGADLLANLPPYLNKEYEYAVMGRDASILERFDQKMYYEGGIRTVNSYNTAEFGRWTAERQRRFFLKFVN